MKRSNPYLVFAATVFSSAAVMYGISYLNCADFGDFRWSETRLYMSLMMGAAMAAIMLATMRRTMKEMYANAKANAAIYVTCFVTFVASLALVRSQAPVHDLAYMRGMIPHHSIAVLTSDHARIRDPRVRQLADRISETQRREIKEMTWLVEDIRKNGLARTADEALRRKTPSL